MALHFGIDVAAPEGAHAAVRGRRPSRVAEGDGKRAVAIAGEADEAFGEFGEFFGGGGGFLARFGMLPGAQLRARNEAAEILITRAVFDQEGIACAIGAEHFGAGVARAD